MKHWRTLWLHERSNCPREDRKGFFWNAICLRTPAWNDNLLCRHTPRSTAGKMWLKTAATCSRCCYHKLIAYVRVKHRSKSEDFKSSLFLPECCYMISVKKKKKHEHKTLLMAIKQENKQFNLFIIHSEIWSKASSQLCEWVNGVRCDLKWLWLL